MTRRTLETSMNEAEDEALPVILCIAGFGDNADMFTGLKQTPLAHLYRLLPINLPGFGAPPLVQETTLHELADYVCTRAKECGSEIVLAHSVASIVASLAAQRPGSPIERILSMEGNITSEDAYFSGTAADFANHETFRASFLARLDDMALSAPIIARYRSAVAQADPLALWQLGRDARHFSDRVVPGEVLATSASVTYFYNPENCPETTLKWLEENPMERCILPDASHWASVDQPELLANMIAMSLDTISG